MHGLGSLRDLLRLGFVAATVLLIVVLPAAANNTSQSGISATTAVGELVINEIDYDQPSTDTAEYLEIKNVSATRQ